MIVTDNFFRSGHSGRGELVDDHAKIGALKVATRA